MKVKTKKLTDRKRQGSHHRHSKDYKQVYWPYLPLMVVSLIIMVVSFIPHQKPGQTLAYAAEMSRESLLTETNQERQHHGQSALALNAKLNSAAQAKAADMAARNYWSHVSPDGEDPWVFVSEAGYKFQKAGENLAYGFSTSSATVQGWMNSQSHRANLLDEKFSEVGFGFVNAANFQNKGQETIIVALYGQPLTDSPAAAGSSAANGNGEPTQPVKSVTKIESMLGSRGTWAPFAIGILSGVSLSGLFINHGLRLRKLLRKGEKYFVAHPLFDVSLVFLIIAVVQLSSTVGYIH